jgi:hypothetical protein
MTRIQGLIEIGFLEGWKGKRPSGFRFEHSLVQFMQRFAFTLILFLQYLHFTVCLMIGSSAASSAMLAKA